MPLPRRYVSNNKKDFFERLVSIATTSVRGMTHTLTINGWKNFIAKNLEIDIDLSSELFTVLVANEVLTFVRLNKGKHIYRSDTTPDYKRHMWISDKEYE